MLLVAVIVLIVIAIAVLAWIPSIFITVLILAALCALVLLAFLAFDRLSERRSRIQREKFPGFSIKQAILSQQTQSLREERELEVSRVSEDHWLVMLELLKERVRVLKERINGIDTALGLEPEFEPRPETASNPHPVTRKPRRPWWLKRWVLERGRLPSLRHELAIVQEDLVEARAAYERSHKMQKSSQ